MLSLSGTYNTTSKPIFLKESGTSSRGLQNGKKKVKANPVDEGGKEGRREGRKKRREGASGAAVESLVRVVSSKKRLMELFQGA
jgi:hypothetical protein